MDIIEFVVGPIKPKAKQSVRFGKGGAFKPKVMRDWEKKFAKLIRPHRPPKPLSVPLRVDIVAIYPRPKYMQFKYKKTGLYKYPKGMIWFASRPDIVNLRKPVEDVMEDEGFYEDDKQIVMGTTAKAYAEIDKPPRIMVRISPSEVLPVFEIQSLGFTHMNIEE